MNETITCPQGHTNPTGQRFCGYCGAALATASAWAEAPEASPPPPPPPPKLATPPPSTSPTFKPWMLVVAVVVIVIGIGSLVGDDESSSSNAPVDTVDPISSDEADVDTGSSFAMPDVVGMGLQDAQDLLQSHGSYLMDQVDATGMDRWQILDSNWVVCSQSPSAGQTVSEDALVTLYVVKIGESCP